MTSVLLPALLLIATLCSSLVAEDAVLDAKRAAAGKLLKDGKRADAQKLYEEIVGLDGTVYSDHLALARLHDKNGDTPSAVASYQTVVKLLGSGAKTPAERSALTESEKRLKMLDQLSQKLEEAIEEFSKKLSDLSKEAEKTKNARALERIGELTAILQSSFSCTVRSDIDLQPTGYKVVSGKSYEVRAAGQWSIGRDVSKWGCTADGNPKFGSTHGAAYGQLIARIGENEAVVALGEQTTFTATNDGELFLGMNDDEGGRKDNAGRLRVEIRPR